MTARNDTEQSTCRRQSDQFASKIPGERAAGVCRSAPTRPPAQKASDARQVDIRGIDIRYVNVEIAIRIIPGVGQTVRAVQLLELTETLSCLPGSAFFIGATDPGGASLVFQADTSASANDERYPAGTEANFVLLSCSSIGAAASEWSNGG